MYTALLRHKMRNSAKCWRRLQEVKTLQNRPTTSNIKISLHINLQNTKLTCYKIIQNKKALE